MSIKPFPPAYAFNMNPADYEWSQHRYVSLEDGGCAIPINSNTQQPNGENTMANAKKITKKSTSTKYAENTITSTPAVKKEKAVRENSPKFSDACISLLKQEQFTDEEMTAKLSSSFPEKQDVPGAIKWYRRKLNMTLQNNDEPCIEELVKDENGKTVHKSTVPPVQKEKAHADSDSSTAVTKETVATKKTASQSTQKDVKKVTLSGKKKVIKTKKSAKK